MAKNRTKGTASLLWFAYLPLLGGTGRPSDGFLSFILLFGFLVFILGILQGTRFVKSWIQEALEDIF